MKFLLTIDSCFDHTHCNRHQEEWTKLSYILIGFVGSQGLMMLKMFSSTSF